MFHLSFRSFGGISRRHPAWISDSWLWTVIVLQCPYLHTWLDTFILALSVYAPPQYIILYVILQITLLVESWNIEPHIPCDLFRLDKLTIIGICLVIFSLLFLFFLLWFTSPIFAKFLDFFKLSFVQLTFASKFTWQVWIITIGLDKFCIGTLADQR